MSRHSRRFPTKSLRKQLAVFSAVVLVVFGLSASLVAPAEALEPLYGSAFGGQLTQQQIMNCLNAASGQLAGLVPGLSDGAQDALAQLIGLWSDAGRPLEDGQIPPGFLAQAPDWVTTLFPPIEIANIVAQCGINAPVALLVWGLDYLTEFDYTAGHGHLAGPGPAGPAANGYSVCRTRGGGDPTCINSGALCQRGGGGDGTCQFAYTGCGCRE